MDTNEIPILETDVLVIGTEGSGARAALAAADMGVRVLALTKGFLGRSGATLTADGEIDMDSRSAKQLFGVDGNEDDSPEQFARDMIVEGDFLADQQLVAIHAEEAPRRIRELVEWGARLEGFIHAPGHTSPRGLWIPGLKLARLLARRMLRSGVQVLENTMALELVTGPDGMLGALAFRLSNGEFLAIRSSAVVLATGGAMRMFPRTTAPDELTGDGLAMALRAGAELQDMEFPMFLPYTLITPQALNGVIFSYDVSALLEVHALNRHGQRYMQAWDPKRMERTTRDINAVAADMEIRSGRGSRHGGTYLSFKHLPKNLVDFSTEWFPDNLKGWRAAGFDLRKFLPELTEEAWEVAPACHFWNGGVRIDADCRTNIPGLFAAGEGTAGIHGANRLAGNALTMTQVWGPRAGRAAAQYAQVHPAQEWSPAGARHVLEKFAQVGANTAGTGVFELRQSIREVSGKLLGIVRRADRLQQALQAVANLRAELPRQCFSGHAKQYNREWVEYFQNENLLDVLEMVVRASLERRESRGALYRQDYPQTDDDGWLANLIIGRDLSGWWIEKRPVQGGTLSLPGGVRPYGLKGADR